MTRRTKRSNNSRPQGRQNAFSGVKLAFLESYKDQFLESTDRGAFYTRVAKMFLGKFGYNLSTEENPPIDDENTDATGENDPALQTPEEQEQDNEHRNKIYRELREKLGCWYRYRYTSKNTNQSYMNHIIEKIMSSSATRPRKKSALKVYTDTNKAQLNEEFNKRWEIVKGTMQSRSRIGSWTEFVKERWETESPAVRDKFIKLADEENATLFKEWKQKAAFAGTPEDLDKAWSMSENILPTFADAMAEWLGANIIILAVAPLGSSNGEIVIRSAQSDTSRGMTKKLISEFDPDGWKKVQQTMLAHGNAYFPPDECHRRVIKKGKSETNLLDDDASMDDLESANVDISLPASAASMPSQSGPSLSQELVLPEPDSTISLIRQQPQEAVSLISSSTPYVTQSSHAPLLPFVESSAQQTPSDDAPNLQPQLDGLYSFLDNDVNMFTFNGQMAQSEHSHQLQHPSTDGAGLSLLSNGCVPSLSQMMDDTSDIFPLSLPFDPVFPATPSQNPSSESLNPPFAIPTSATPSSLSPSSAIPSSVTPSFVAPSLVIPFSVAPSPVIPCSETLSSAMSSSSMTPPSVFPPSETPSSVFPPSETPPSETPSSKILSSVTPSSEFTSSNGATTTSMVLTPVTANSVKTPPSAVSALSPPDHHGKENTAADKATAPVGLGKKRKMDVKSANNKGKRSKVMEDNSTTINMHAAQEKETPEESGTAETAPTRSGRRSNLPSRFKDAGYAPPKRNVRKKDT